MYSAFAVIGLVSIMSFCALPALAYEYKDPSWQENENVTTDAVYFVINLIPLLIKLAIFAGLIVLGWVGFSRVKDMISG